VVISTTDSRDENGSYFVTHHGPTAITLFHPKHGTRRGRGIMVLDNPPLGLDSEKS